MVSRSTEAPVSLGEYVPTADQRVMLWARSWADYEGLIALRGERRSPRIAYLDGAIELMTTSRDHELIKVRIGRLLEAYCIHNGIHLHPYGNWTQRAAPKAAAVEPDECYIFGPDPKTSDRPHLVIEVVWTSGGLDKLEAYRRLAIDEVWYWKRDELIPYVLGPAGYEPRERSARVPDLDLALVCRLAMTEPSLNELLETFHAALRDG